MSIRSLRPGILAGLACLCFAGNACAEEIVISAAASLAQAFRELGGAFESEHPGSKIDLNFAASGALLQQIERGAPVDVFATADEETMSRAAARRLILTASRKSFASNRLVLVVPAQAKLGIASVEDLKRDSVKRIAIGIPASVPAGHYARDALCAAGAWDALQPKLINAESVRQVLDYVARAEVDAGFVYLTDAWLAKDKVRVVGEIKTAQTVEYPIAVVATTQSPQLDSAWIEYVLSPHGQAILAKYRFGSP